jgi:hypothetical protein
MSNTGYVLARGNQVLFRIRHLSCLVVCLVASTNKVKIDMYFPTIFKYSSLVKLNSPPYLMVLMRFVCSSLVCHVRSPSLLFILFSVYFVITCKTFHIDSRLFYHVKYGGEFNLISNEHTRPIRTIKYGGDFK